MITNEAVDELGLLVGQDAYALVKASDVMVAVDPPAADDAGPVFIGRIRT